MHGFPPWISQDAVGAAWRGVNKKKVEVMAGVRGAFGPLPGKPTPIAVKTGQETPTATTLSFRITCVSPAERPVMDFIRFTTASTIRPKAWVGVAQPEAGSPHTRNPKRPKSALLMGFVVQTQGRR